MGSVWEARHETLGLRVAIKFIEKEYADSKEARSRFDNEAKAAAKIQSKHLIKIFDHGVTPDGKPYIVMELLEGEPLDKRLERLGRMPLQDVARILHQVSRGLTRAHSEHIIHRDLKPENIFLTQSTDDDEEVAKVLDFGIAKIRSTDQTLSNSTKTGAVLGTPYYMSPEQARGLRDIDHRTDVWSLGVIVFKCVTGVLPFEGESLGDLLVKICTAPLPVPSHVLPGLPQSFDAWFARTLDREPARRFANVAEMADALAYLSGVSVRRNPSSGASGRELDPAFRSSPSFPGDRPQTVPSAPPAAQAFTPPYPQHHTPAHATPPNYGVQTPGPGATAAVPYASARPNVTATGLAASTPRGGKSSSVTLVLGIVVGVVTTIVLMVIAFRMSPSTEDKAKAAARHPSLVGAGASATDKTVEKAQAAADRASEKTTSAADRASEKAAAAAERASEKAATAADRAAERAALAAEKAAERAEGLATKAADSAAIMADKAAAEAAAMAEKASEAGAASATSPAAAKSTTRSRTKPSKENPTGTATTPPASSPGPDAHPPSEPPPRKTHTSSAGKADDNPGY
ncbi:protein kinase [Pendulispora albinea]|uniref:Protein kinase n=2 Tax=Pendulispora albinea TaxID=2741071 RepID=A0ABZ2M3C2_9BACT